MSNVDAAYAAAERDALEKEKTRASGIKKRVGRLRLRLSELGSRRRVDPRQKQNDEVQLRAHISRLEATSPGQKEVLVAQRYDPQSGK